MQNAGQQYGQGAAPTHQGTPYGHTESSASSTGSITSSLRQFRKKDVDKQQVNDTTSTTTGESHVARVAPHNHYPPRTNESYRYPPQFPDYSLTSQVKYSEISNLHTLQEPVPPTVIQKPKAKDYMEVCNLQQPHMKQPYTDHLNGQQYAADSNLHPHPQYPHKDHQIHPMYKPESQYFPKEPQYQQLTSHQMQKCNMPTQMRKYPPENDFLSKLRRIHPSMARSIMSDHHLQESQSSYQAMEQNRMYPHQNQRYMNYTASLQGNPYPHNYLPPQNYPNYPASCSYNRPPQMTPRFPPINPHERSISPRRGYSDNLIPPMNYAGLPQKISPNYPQYNAPEYAQHYQHRRGPQDYYQQHCRSTQYLPHQMTQQEMTESRVTVSDSIKQYIENWADEETASEMNQMDNNRLCKETLRVRDDQSTETVYMINASELQYLENGIPLVTSENGIPLVTSENGQYIIKSGVSIDNSTAMVRIMDKSNHAESDTNGERVVNLHIMDTFKPDCMLANKPNEMNQRQEELPYRSNDKPKVVIHQNAIIQPSHQNAYKEVSHAVGEVLQAENKMGNSLPIITDTDIPQDPDPLEKFEETIFKECKKETADKNCSPINVEEIEAFEGFKDHAEETSVICPTKPFEQSDINETEEPEDATKLKNMPIIELLIADAGIKHPNTVLSENNKNDTERKIESDLNIQNVNEENFEEKFSPKDKTNDINDELIKQLGITEATEENMNEDIIENEELILEEGIETENTDKMDHLKEGHNVCEDDDIAKKENIEHNQTGDINNVESMDIDKIVQSDTKDVESMTVDTTDEPKEEANMELAANITETVNKDETINENKEVIKDKDDAVIKDDVFVKADSKEIINTNVVNTAPASSEKTEKLKRSKRIFSVDDIINNIGTNLKGMKSETETIERRRSIHTTREFLEKEIDHSTISIFKPLKTEVKNKEIIVPEEIDGTDVPTTDPPEEPKCEEAIKILESTENPAVQTLDTEIVEDRTEEENIETSNTSICTGSETNSDLNISNIGNDNLAQNVVQSTTQCEKKNEIPENSNKDLIINKPIIDKEKPVNEKPITTCEAESEVTSAVNVEEETSNNEIHYRNAIRVEESNVLLEIAGELVEINVVTVNGKKVITVVPLSETTVVDFNDNYETVENSDAVETKIIDNNANDAVAGVVSLEEVVPETEVIESTSEIIIGMDISLEEEIQLDLEKPPVLCTKAAKKAYENDLQIPSITTSEDVNDDNKIDFYVNDKVSSSKEQVKEKKESRSDKIHSSSKTQESKHAKVSPEKQHKESDRKTLKELLKVRKIKKDEVRMKSEEEDFIPFKDLVKARNLKKQKLQQLKCNENVSADSTNKIEHEESNQAECESKEKVVDKETKKIEDAEKNKLTENKTGETKFKNRSIKNYRRSSSSEVKTENSPEKHKIDDKIDAKSDADKVNSSTSEKSGDINDKIKEKCAKKVTFGSVDYKNLDDDNKPTQPQIRNYKLEDPRLKKRCSTDVVVPSVSEILKENAVVENGKKRLSLEEYNRRKRKLNNPQEAEVKPKKQDTEEKTSPQKPPVPEKLPVETRKFVLIRPKSLEDVKAVDKPRDAILAKRKFSLEESFCRPNYLDWEDTQSPKTNLASQDKSDKRLSEFSGLIDNNKSKIVIDINDLNLKPTILENSEDEVLQTYKEQVDSKLSTLNIQIPRVAKTPNVNPFSNPETNNLIERFLNNEKITLAEMEKIKKIISYKRMVQQLNKIKSPETANMPLNPSYEIKKDCPDKDMKLHLKKVPDKKKKRFMNLYSESTSGSGSDSSETKDATCDYSVVQSECYAPAGVPKLIIKRKTEMPVPVVRLERLDLDQLAAKKRKTF